MHLSSLARPTATRAYLSPLYRRRALATLTTVDRLRQEYQVRKQQHVNAANRDGAAILGVSGNVDQLNDRLHYGVSNKVEDDPPAIYGFGVTQPHEVYVFSGRSFSFCFLSARLYRFINNELNLKQIEVYGFDYDVSEAVYMSLRILTALKYTLANYTDELSNTIYNILRDILVDMFRYPKEIKGKSNLSMEALSSTPTQNCNVDFRFDPSFAIRGLHFGWLIRKKKGGRSLIST